MADRVGPAVGEYLRLSAERFPERRSLVSGDGSYWTFAETNARVNRLVDALASRGIGRGDRVAIFAVNGPGYAEVLFACLKLGCVYVPLNNRLRPEEVAGQLKQASPLAVFTDARYGNLLRPLFVSLSVRLAVAFDGAVDGFDSYEALLAAGAPVEPEVRLGDEDIVGLAFTSGTTGTPKGVLQSQRMLRNLTTSITIDYEIRPDEFRYSSSPLFHIGGQSPVLMHAWRGFPTLLLPQFSVDEVLPWMQSGGLTGCFLVPTMISAILADPRVGDSDYPELQSIVYGAAPMPPSVLRRAIEVFECDFVNAFGAGTETGLQTVLGSMDHRRAADGEERILGSIGKPAYGVALRLLDEQGEPVARGEVGEIVTRNGQTMSGYLDMPEATAEALSDDGWFRAGDLAWQDDEGYLYLAGRRSDMIIRGGENIYPIEVEDVLCQHSAIAEAAVVGSPDEHWGEVVVGFVVAAPGAELDPAAVLAHCRERLASYKVPLRVEVVDALPLNASGKVMRRELRKALADLEK